MPIYNYMFKPQKSIRLKPPMVGMYPTKPVSELFYTVTMRRSKVAKPAQRPCPHTGYESGLKKNPPP